MWDYTASQRHDTTIANSKNVQARLRKYYKKESIVIFPPIETKRFQSETLEVEKESILQSFGLKEKKYYIIISALTEFKKIERAIEYFKEKDTLSQLVIV
jgi:glycosyltransferase involved in cell wall biosynthesis